MYKDNDMSNMVYTVNGIALTLYISTALTKLYI